jgi:hypothetical protein
MSTNQPPQELIDEIIDATGFKRSVVEYLYDEYLEDVADGYGGTFNEHLGNTLGCASFVIAASKGFSINGCLAAYDYGYQTVSEEGIHLDDLESIIDDIELEGLPAVGDDDQD